MRATRIKALSHEEFEAACTNGSVSGEYMGKEELYIYAQLGMEKEYNLSHNDDPKTDYRMFINCTLFLAKTLRQLDEGEFDSKGFFVPVLIIYY